MAWKSHDACCKGDFHSAFKVLRLLKGYEPKPIKSVKKADGTLTSNERERQERWQEYFCDLFNGSVTDDMQSLATEPLTPASPSVFQPSLAAWAQALRELGH
eukprot:4847536-Karenia_brevis.AAC.1